MTTTAHTMNSPAAAFGVSGRSAGGLLGRLRERLAEHARYVRTRDELTALTDRELEDIGLVRADIEGISRRAARIA